MNWKVPIPSSEFIKHTKCENVKGIPEIDTRRRREVLESQMCSFNSAQQNPKDRWHAFKYENDQLFLYIPSWYVLVLVGWLIPSEMLLLCCLPITKEPNTCGLDTSLPKDDDEELLLDLEKDMREGMKRWVWWIGLDSNRFYTLRYDDECFVNGWICIWSFMSSWKKR